MQVMEVRRTACSCDYEFGFSNRVGELVDGNVWTRCNTCDAVWLADEPASYPPVTKHCTRCGLDYLDDTGPNAGRLCGSCHQLMVMRGSRPRRSKLLRLLTHQQQDTIVGVLVLVAIVAILALVF